MSKVLELELSDANNHRWFCSLTIHFKHFIVNVKFYIHSKMLHVKSFAENSTDDLVFFTQSFSHKGKTIKSLNYKRIKNVLWERFFLFCFWGTFCHRKNSSRSDELRYSEIDLYRFKKRGKFLRFHSDTPMLSFPIRYKNKTLWIYSFLFFLYKVLEDLQNSHTV